MIPLFCDVIIISAYQISLLKKTALVYINIVTQKLKMRLKMTGFKVVVPEAATELTLICSKSIVEALEKGVKYVQS